MPFKANLYKNQSPSNLSLVTISPGDTLQLVLHGLYTTYQDAVVTFSCKVGSFRTDLTAVANSLPAFPSTSSLSITLPSSFTNSQYTIELVPTQTLALDLNTTYALELEFLLSTGEIESWQFVFKTGQDIVGNTTPATAGVNNRRNLGNFATAPVTAVQGDCYYNTTLSKYYERINGAWVEFGAGAGSTNLSYTASPTQGQVNSDTGNDAVIPATDVTNAGLFLPAEKTKLAGIDMSTKIDLNGNNSAITYANFTPSVAPAYQEGRVFYDSTSKALSVYDNISGTSIQLGKELVIDVRNNSGVSILNGEAVYITGATGQMPTISKAIASSENSSKVIGIATHNIDNNTNGKVTIYGGVNDLNTSTYSDGDILYLSASVAGGLTTTPPASPNFVRSVGIVILANPVQGKIEVLNSSTKANNNNLGTSQAVSPSQNAVKQYVDNGLVGKENTVTAGTTGQYWRGDKTFQTLDKTAVGLANVDNTSDLNKSISTATQTALNLKQNALGFTPENVANKENTTLDTSTTKYPTNNLVKTNLDLKANLASPTFTGVVTVNQIKTTKQTLTPAATTQTIDWNNGSIIDLILSSASGNVTLTLSNPQTATTYLIEVTNGATPRNLVFPIGTLQASGGGNLYIGTANQKDVIAVLWDGIQFLITVSRNFS